MISVAVFNNKGGVGKTTLVCNICAYLARVKKKKVALIDADPQCNASAYCFNYTNYNNVYLKRGGYTIYDYVKSVDSGIGYSDSFSIYNIKAFGFELLAGDPKLALFEDTLASDWGDTISGKERGIRTTLIFKKIVTLLNDYDYVFFDMSPSLGAINRSIIIASDYFITPLSSDIFSIYAIENIGERIKNWTESFADGYNRAANDGIKEEFGEIYQIKYLGYVTQQYTSKTIEGKKRPVMAYERILRRVPETIREKLINVLEQGGINDITMYELGAIPNFNSVVPLSQSAHKPIFALTSKDGVVGAHFQKIKEYESVVEIIVNNMLLNMEKLS